MEWVEASQVRFVTRVKRKVCKMIVQSAIMYSAAITKRQEAQVNLEIKVRKARLRSFGHVQKSVHAEQSMLNMELSGRKKKKRPQKKIFECRKGRNAESYSGRICW